GERRRRALLRGGQRASERLLLIRRGARVLRGGRQIRSAQLAVHEPLSFAVLHRSRAVAGGFEEPFGARHLVPSASERGLSRGELARRGLLAYRAQHLQALERVLSSHPRRVHKTLAPRHDFGGKGWDSSLRAPKSPFSLARVRR